MVRASTLQSWSIIFLIAGPEYSEPLGFGVGQDQFYGLRLGLEAETQMISVSKLRLIRFRGGGCFLF